MSECVCPECLSYPSPMPPEVFVKHIRKLLEMMDTQGFHPDYLNATKEAYDLLEGLPEDEL